MTDFDAIIGEGLQALDALGAEAFVLRGGEYFGNINEERRAQEWGQGGDKAVRNLTILYDKTRPPLPANLHEGEKVVARGNTYVIDQIRSDGGSVTIELVDPTK